MKPNGVPRSVAEFHGVSQSSAELSRAQCIYNCERWPITDPSVLQLYQDLLASHEQKHWESCNLPESEEVLTDPNSTCDPERMTIDPNCVWCTKRYRDPKPEQLTMCLHALSYKVRQHTGLIIESLRKCVSVYVNGKRARIDKRLKHTESAQWLVWLVGYCYVFRGEAVA